MLQRAGQRTENRPSACIQTGSYGGLFAFVDIAIAPCYGFVGVRSRPCRAWLLHVEQPTGSFHIIRQATGFPGPRDSPADQGHAPEGSAGAHSYRPGGRCQHDDNGGEEA